MLSEMYGVHSYQEELKGKYQELKILLQKKYYTLAQQKLLDSNANIKEQFPEI
jgi:hypothetical protein